MIGKRQPLDVREGLPFVEVRFRKPDGGFRNEWLILDFGASHTILSVELSTALGLRRPKKSTDVIFDAPDRPMRTYLAHLPGLAFCGREIENYPVYCKVFQEDLHVPGLLGFDYFHETDFFMSRKRNSVYLSW